MSHAKHLASCTWRAFGAAVVVEVDAWVWCAEALGLGAAAWVEYGWIRWPEGQALGLGGALCWWVGVGVEVAGCEFGGKSKTVW